ncbi:MAG: homocysteine S-methyltransferase family protein [Bacteroidales bacterium]|jgi:5-methyltetrahydrofolate--homocysteine methyltransferase|nr:homocysteine S-methyltransferase family protein [Bacteroidales bacterium]
MLRITDVLKTGKILISDGAWGTFLYQKGLKQGDCPDEWSLTHPADVEDVARSYIEAGADMIETNSFGASRQKLGFYGLGDRAADINEAAARLSRKAAGDKFVIASMGPSGELLMMGNVSADELYDSFREQAVALEKGGANAACIETMSDADEAVLAIRAVKEHTALEVIATFTFNKTEQNEYRTMMGLSPVDAAQTALAAGADIIGANCGNGIENMTEIVHQLREAFPKAFILIHANAGLPVIDTHGNTTFPETPEIMAAHIPALLNAGVNIIGGCCGTTPEHIRAIRKAVQSYNRITV